MVLPYQYRPSPVKTKRMNTKQRRRYYAIRNALREPRPWAEVVLCLMSRERLIKICQSFLHALQKKAAKWAAFG
jgi:hypothetical protein